MAKLEFLNSFFTERLIAAAGEIFQVVKDTISEYEEEIDRANKENRRLRDMLLVSISHTGGQLRDVLPSPAEDRETNQEPPPSEPMIQVKLEVCTVQQETEPQQPSTVGQCTTAHMDTDLTQDPLSCVQDKAMDTEEKDSSVGVDPVPVKAELCDSRRACSESSDSSAAQREQESSDYFEIDEDDPGSRSCHILFNALPELPSQNELTDGLFYCKICNKPFKTYLWLEKHMANHTNEERHVCNVCGKRFRLAQTLESHINNHTRERPYCCQYCGKGFGQRSHVKDHERIHTGERPFPCPICQKCFVQRSQLMSHIHTHSYMIKDLSEINQRKRPT
ncbi:zinc finger and SCAN domain-containing protein 5C-like [Hoplias malabaricus]|uniref:zinc finger and SCAN domain-containing protein 5C-like n=1 Tax=Hoplias malabaricus TaxID=27720 RepID=UPI0034632028